MSVLRRGKDKVGTSQSTAGDGPSRDQKNDSERNLLDGAVDALAAIIRAWGDHPIELPERTLVEIRDECEAWARHLLIATEPPGEAAVLAKGERDWIGVERNFRRLRQQETAHVMETQSGLRHALWVCIQALGKASVSDSRCDGQVSERLSTLRSAAQASDVAVLRREVTATVNLLDSHIEARRARYESQVGELSDKLQHMTAAFVREREAGQLDALTKVYCRAALDDHVSDICQMAQIITPSAIMFLMDVDHFKWVNDEFGHTAGDDILQRVSAAMRREYRRRGDFIARYGGDEFVAVIEEGTLENAVTIGERVLSAVREVEALHKEQTIRVGMSMGIAPLRQGETPREWLDRADAALYASKNAGRDRLSVAD